MCQDFFFHPEPFSFSFIQHLLGFRFSALYRIFILIEQTSVKWIKVRFGFREWFLCVFKDKKDDDAFFLRILIFCWLTTKLRMSNCIGCFQKNCNLKMATDQSLKVNINLDSTNHDKQASISATTSHIIQLQKKVKRRQLFAFKNNFSWYLIFT